MSAGANSQMVRIVRQSLGWTQGTLARHAGLSQGYISKVEAGGSDLRGDALEAVARALGCLPELLAYDKPAEGLQITCLHAPSARQPLDARCDRPGK